MQLIRKRKHSADMKAASIYYSSEVQLLSSPVSASDLYITRSTAIDIMNN